MLKYYSPNLNESAMFQTLLSVGFFDIEMLVSLWKDYFVYAKTKNRVIGEPKWRIEKDAINVIGIRNNPEISFNEKKVFYNDLLVIAKTTPKEIYVFKVTMDPKGRIHKVAHLLEGVYASYTALRPHKYVPGRTAIVQDRNSLLVARTDKNGNVIVKDHKGWFGINIHDAGGFINSSIGCTVLEMDSNENGKHWENTFKPLIANIANKDSIDYSVMNYDYVSAKLEQIVKNKFLSDDFVNSLAFRGFEIIKPLGGIYV